MFRPCLLLLAGMYAVQLNSFGVLVAASAAGAALLVYPRSLRPVGWACAGAGLFVMSALEVTGSRLEAEYAGDSIVTRVRVADFPTRRSASVSFLAAPIDEPRLPARIRVSWFEPPVALRLGDVWELELRLRRPRGNQNPGVFDHEAWLFRSRISATAYVADGWRNRLVGAEPGVVDEYRQQFVDRLTSRVGNAEAAAALAAVTVGARHLISAEQWERYARTGVSHLMAISGLHVGLAAGFSYSLFGVISGLARIGRNHHRLATIAGCAIAAMYTLISGLGIPSIRASLMLLLAAAAASRLRRPAPLDIVATACAAIVVSFPLATMAPGFKLSFAAVLLLWWFSQRRFRRRRASNRLFSAVMQLGRLQLFLLFGLLPLTVLVFDRVAVLAPVVNLVAVPVFSAITVPLSLLALVLAGPAQLAGDLALTAAAASLLPVEWLITRLATVSEVGHRVPALVGGDRLLLMLPLAWVLLPPGWPGRGLAWLGTAAVLFYQPPATPAGCVDLDVLDVGQGLATVISTSSQTLLYDTGPSFRSGGSAARSVIEPYLRSRGVTRLHTLLVSHSDLDHAGGVADIQAAFEIDRFIAGEALSVPAGPAQPCEAGFEWWADGIRFRLLHPTAGSDFEGNDASCVLSVRAGPVGLLLTGDVEVAAETAMLQRDVSLAHDVVIVPHHGSRTSSTGPFVAGVGAGIAIVSAAHGNRWGLPKDDVMRRWQDAGSLVLNTAEHGAVMIRACATRGIVQVVKQRHAGRRIWHE
jgi:competence protein ComEC